MKFRLLQSTSEVRDAGEISFGLLVLGIVLMPVALGVGFFAGLLVSLVMNVLWPAILPKIAIYIVPVCALLLWLGAMWLVVRRYLRVASDWNGERRGSNMIHLVEWLTVGISFALSFANPDRRDEAVVALQLFLSVLMLLLLLCHAATYCLLRYRPARKEILIWCVLTGAVAAEIVRRA